MIQNLKGRQVFYEDVIVKDYAHQGLAIFLPQDAAHPGSINCWATLMSEKPGTRPDMATASMCYDEADMSYYYRGRKPSADDPRVLPFLERYRMWAESFYGGPCELKLRRVFKDSQGYRKERW